jgi:hypothetical protein
MRAMITGATRSDEERQADANDINVLSAFTWRRLEPIQSAMAVEQPETAADRAAVLSGWHDQ